MGYLDGINQYMEEVTPIEFQLVCRKENSPLKMFIIFLDTCLLVMAHKTDPLLTDIRNKYGVP
jgi:penicillin amidase